MFKKVMAIIIVFVSLNTTVSNAYMLPGTKAQLEFHKNVSGYTQMLSTYEKKDEYLQETVWLCREVEELLDDSLYVVSSKSPFTASWYEDIRLLSERAALIQGYSLDRMTPLAYMHIFTSNENMAFSLVKYFEYLTLYTNNPDQYSENKDLTLLYFQSVNMYLDLSYKYVEAAGAKLYN